MMTENQKTLCQAGVLAVCLSILIALGVVFGSLLLVGCAAQTSAQQHARHYVYHYMEAGDANLIVDKSGSVKALQPEFDHIYEAGQKARAAGLTPAQAEAQFITLQMTGKSDFSNHEGKTFSRSYSDRELNGLKAEVQATFLDGYYGK